MVPGGPGAEVDVEVCGVTLGQVTALGDSVIRALGAQVAGLVAFNVQVKIPEPPPRLPV